MYKASFILFFVLMTVFFGCNLNSKCKPVLFPYSEYGYEAVAKGLAGSYVRQDQDKFIAFFNLNLKLLDNIHYEKVFTGKTLKITLDENRFFLLNAEKGKIRDYSIEGFNFIGCEHLTKIEMAPKTDKEYWSDVFLFTADEVKSNPSFWEYYILWSKTEFLRDTTKLIHFKGERLEAFQRNIKPKVCGDGSEGTFIVIFPERIAPDYLKIAACFVDDEFFESFLDMLDLLNL
jgi:hypothetical protein